MKTAKDILKCYNEWNYGQYREADVIDAMQEYALQVAEAVRDEAVRIQNNWRGDEHDEAIEAIDLSQFIK